MSVSNRVFMLLVSMLLFYPLASLAEAEAHAKAGQVDDGIELSADLQLLLRQEMMAIQNGMRDLIPAMSAGAWSDMASIAQNISDSFIMKQKLTAAQKEELHAVLPQGFIEMDQDFHKSAAMLAHAAGMKNPDVVNFYFFKLNNACVACHTKYASERFPGLSKDGEREDHRH